MKASDAVLDATSVVVLIVADVTGRSVDEIVVSVSGPCAFVLLGCVRIFGCLELMVDELIAVVWVGIVSGRAEVCESVVVSVITFGVFCLLECA